MNDWLQARTAGCTLYVVSDLHLGDGSAMDNFFPHLQRFEAFLSEVVEKDPSSCLVLAGDVFEFWQSQHGEVVRRYMELLHRLVSHGSIFIIGNHDVDLLGLVDLPVEFPLLRCLTERLTLDRGGRTVHVVHGHQFDAFNDPRKAMLFGRIATLAAGIIELAVGGTVDGRSTEDVLWEAWESHRPLPRRVWDVAKTGWGRAALGMLVGTTQFIRRVWFRTASQRAAAGEPLDQTREEMERYHQEHPGHVLITGHTHRAGWHEGWHVNVGAWQGPEAHYARVTPEGDITLHAFPGGATVTTQLWGERVR